MKPTVRFYKGKWWCSQQGVMGSGNSIKEAWDNMIEAQSKLLNWD